MSLLLGADDGIGRNLLGVNRFTTFGGIQENGVLESEERRTTHLR
jgi:hypothetical protein